MDANQVCSVEDGGGDGCGGGEFGFVGIFARYEMLARGAGEDGQVETGQLADLCQDLGVLLFTLAKAEAGIDADRHLVHTGNLGAMDGGAEVVEDGADHVLHGRHFGPRFGRAAHVIQDQRSAGVGNGFRQHRVKGQGAGIIDDLDAERESFGGDSGLIGIDRDRHLEVALKALEDRNQAAELFGFGDPGGAGPGGFGTDINDVRSLLFELDGAGEGAVGVGVLAAVGEGIRGDIQDAHDEGPVT